MQQIAWLLMILGFGSMGLHLVNMEFRLLGWIDAWGPDVAWAIRIALGVVGIALFFIGRKQEAAKAAS